MLFSSDRSISVVFLGPNCRDAGQMELRSENLSNNHVTSLEMRVGDTWRVRLSDSKFSIKDAQHS